MKTVNISCPACSKGTMVIEANALLQGYHFNCNTCGAVLSLQSESSNILKEGIKVYNELQENIAKQNK